MNIKKIKILFVTGSRGEWGYIRPILELIKRSFDIEYEICATNMHLLPNFGNSIDEISNDGFEIKYKINMSLDGYNHFTQVKSLAIFLSSFSDILDSSMPDWILLAGDRGEQLMGAIAGAYTYIPVAHIQAGEKSGNIDGTARHAIGKLAHIHFASNKDASKRLINLGEQDFRVFNVGAPQIDELVEDRISSNIEIMKKLNFNISCQYILFVQHPVTEEFDKADFQIKETIKALTNFDLPIVVILPNNDAGSLIIRKNIENLIIGKVFIFSNLKREEYLALLRNTKVIIGNSSSGLLEAPTFNTPAVNIGRRQNDRVQGLNVINCEHDASKITKAIDKAISKNFKKMLNEKCKNPYGDGESSKKILDVIRNTEINNKLIMKDITC